MKTTILILIAATTLANAQTAIERMGGSIGRRSVPKSSQQLEKERKADELNAAKQAAGTNIIRVVDGKAYNVILSTNWITIPGDYHIGKFVRPANDGAVFELQKKMSVSFGPSLSSGGRIWYEFDREVLIKNYVGKIAGDTMPRMRVLPIGTSPDGIAIYDYGTPPRPRVVNTNAPTAPSDGK